MKTLPVYIDVAFLRELPKTSPRYLFGRVSVRMLLRENVQLDVHPWIPGESPAPDEPTILILDDSYELRPDERIDPDLAAQCDANNVLLTWGGFVVSKDGSIVPGVEFRHTISELLDLEVA